MVSRPFFYTAEKPENSPRMPKCRQKWHRGGLVVAPMVVEFKLGARFEQYYFAKAESKASFEGSKSTFLQNWAASLAPASRSMPESSHSTERGPV